MSPELITGIQNVFSGNGIMYTTIGAAIGYLFGFLPGLSASVALSLLIPITYGMKPVYAMMMLAGVLGGVNFGGSISAILINAPGTGANAATAVDGFQLSKKGRAGEALGASALSSFLGHAFGIVLFILSLPIMVKIVLLLGPPEWFALGAGGLFLVASVSGGSIINGVIAAGIGLLLSTHGANPVIGGMRYTFDQMWLWDGLSMVPVIVGLMALSALTTLYGQNKTISRSGSVEKGGTFRGMVETIKHLPLVIISGSIGVFIGAVPGIGGNVSTWLALSAAKGMSKHPEEFGKGTIEGVIGPESANDATEGGALMPLVSLGIPGSPSTAVLLGALMMHGLQPGQKMLTQQLDIVYSLSIAHLFGALIACSVGLALANYIAKITTIPSKLLAPVLVLVCLTGAFAAKQNLTDLYIATFFGIIGYAMNKCNYPRVPLLLGLILGKLIEYSFQTSMQLWSNNIWMFFTRPIAVLFLMFIPGTLVVSAIIKSYKKKKKKALAA